MLLSFEVGTTHVLLRSVRTYLDPGCDLLASASWPTPKGCCQTSGTHSERPRGLPLGLSVVVHAPHWRDNPGPLEECARVFGAQWEAPGFSIVFGTPGVLHNKPKPLREAVEVDQYTFCCCSCPSWVGQSGCFFGACAGLWSPMGGSWLQHRGQGPGRAAQQAGATRNGRGGYPWDFLLLFMPLIGGTIRVLWRSVREYLVPNGRLLASASCSAPQACCTTSRSHSERP